MGPSAIHSEWETDPKTRSLKRAQTTAEMEGERSLPPKHEHPTAARRTHRRTDGSKSKGSIASLLAVANTVERTKLCTVPSPGPWPQEQVARACNNSPVGCQAEACIGRRGVACGLWEWDTQPGQLTVGIAHHGSERTCSARHGPRAEDLLVVLATRGPTWRADLRRVIGPLVRARASSPPAW